MLTRLQFITLLGLTSSDYSSDRSAMREWCTTGYGGGWCKSIKSLMKNAIIESTSLGYEDRGIFTFNIGLDYGDSGHQSFGDWALGGNYTNFVIKGILDAVGVAKWEDLLGTHVRVKFENHKISEIGHILKNEWFNPQQEPHI